MLRRTIRTRGSPGLQAARPGIPTSPDASARLLGQSIPMRPRIALQLGTGFGGVATALKVDWEQDYARIPGFPSGAVPGHAGKLMLGRLDGIPVWVLNGRAHYYEGFELSEIAFPIRTLAALGVSTLVLTNAAGGLRRGFRPGDFMILSDHINGLGENPLRGPTPAGLPRFLDLSQVYDPSLRRLLQQAARSVGARCHEGVYLAVSGPTFETPAEIRAFARLGADAIGMSTVPEAIVARQLGVRVSALSLITNVAAGRRSSEKGISHESVLKNAGNAEGVALRLLRDFIPRVDSAHS